MTRREFILNATATQRAKFAKLQDELRAIDAEMSAKLAYGRLVRLTDRRWDVSAQLKMVGLELDAAAAKAAAEYSA